MTTAAPQQNKSEQAAEALRALCAEYDSGAIARRFATEPTFAVNLRRRGMMAAQAQGLPKTSDEEWRFTPITRLLPLRFSAPVPDAPVPDLPEVATLRSLFQNTIVLVDGYYRRELSSLGTHSKGLSISSLRDALAADSDQLGSLLGKVLDTELHAFTGLNAALFTDGVVINVAANAVVEDPIHIVHVSTGKSASHLRHLVHAQAGSSVTVIESFIGPASEPYLVNAALEVVVDENATVDHYRYQAEGDQAFLFVASQARQARNSNYSTQSYNWGALIARNDLGTVFQGPGATGTINGLYLIGGQQLMDHHTRIDHAIDHCESHELYRGILDGASRGVFNGRIYVRQDAQKTNALQTNKNLLLSADAQINTNPQLEIFADDVKCTHGATVGQLDPVQLYYLRSRGISADDAQRMLTFAFANDLIQRIVPAGLRRHLETRILLPGVTLEDVEA